MTNRSELREELREVMREVIMDSPTSDAYGVVIYPSKRVTFYTGMGKPLYRAIRGDITKIDWYNVWPERCMWERMSVEGKIEILQFILDKFKSVNSVLRDVK